MLSQLVVNDLPFPTHLRAPRRLPQSKNLIQCQVKPTRCSFHNDRGTTLKKPSQDDRVDLIGPISSNTLQAIMKKSERKDHGYAGASEITTVCGFGYFIQGFRCFPWLALNFHMAHYLNLDPSTLQLVQHSGNFPMVAKPLFGMISDAVYINGDHRIPYVLIGAVLQAMAWIPLAVTPAAREALPTLMSCILLSNVGASVAEVANDALVTEYGQRHRLEGLQSYAFMGAALGGILGNLIGGHFLANVRPKSMFLAFASLLLLQFVISSAVRENSLGLSSTSRSHRTKGSVVEHIKKQANELRLALSKESISGPLLWVVASIAMVPLLSGSVFCYQTQILHLDPSVVGMSRVVSQLVLFFMTMLYNRYLNEVPMRVLVCSLQIMYACSLLLDFVLVRRINLQLGIPDEIFVLCFSGIAETLAQFKLLPFSVFLASNCPRGCEGSLTSFMASVWCLSSIISGLLGVALASTIGITVGEFSALPVGILVQFATALLPLCGISRLPNSLSMVNKPWKSKETSTP